MADDLDDALFSLAAGRNKPSSKKRSRKASDSDEDGVVDSDADSEEAPRRKKANKGSGSKRGKRPQSEDEDDEDDGDFDDEEGLYENEEDRRKLMAMTELEREMILAERAETRDKERQRRQLLQQQRAATEKADKGRRKQDRHDAGRAKGSDGKGTPRKAARGSTAARSARDWSDEDEDGGRRSSGDEEEFRPSSSSGAISEEEEGQAGRLALEEDHGERVQANTWGQPEALPPPPPPPITGAVVGGSTWGQPGEDEDRRQSAAAAAAAAAAAVRNKERERMRDRERNMSDDEEAHEEATLEELLTCQVTRSQLEEWFTQPFFERDALSGCVVRMAYGPGMRDASGNAHPGYMIMEITDIRESGRAYPFGPRGEMTHKYLVLRDGLGITRVMAMANVSSKPFDEAEYERYKRHCGRVNRAPITREEAATAAKKVEASTNYRWTSADLKLELERKRASRAAPVNPAAEKAMLKRRIELAQGAGNIDEVATLEEQLAALEAHLLNQNNNKRAFGMMDLNKRNKQHNLTVAYKTTAAEEHGGTDGTGGNDVFSRRATTLNIYWNTKGNRRDGIDDDGQSAGAAAAARAQASLPDKLTRAQQRMDPADLIRQLGLEVDLLLLRTAPVVPTLQQRLLPPRWRMAVVAAHKQDLTGKSVLSVADWKRRAGEY